MSWREAFFIQARSDYAVLKRLEATRVEVCHQLHYLQMATEKLAKAIQIQPERDEPPQRSHAVAVRMLQILKNRPDIRRMLGFRDFSVFNRYIDSLLDTADRIERLAPALAGLSQPNPEYPWLDTGHKKVIPPAAYDFPGLAPKDLKLLKFEQLIEQLLVATA